NRPVGAADECAAPPRAVHHALACLQTATRGVVNLAAEIVSARGRIAPLTAACAPAGRPPCRPPSSGGSTCRKRHRLRRFLNHVRRLRSAESLATTPR